MRCLCVCVCVCIFLKLRITAQSGPVILSLYWYYISHLMPLAALSMILIIITKTSINDETRQGAHTLVTCTVLNLSPGYLVLPPLLLCYIL